jgi:hypothetical protein
MLLTIRAQIFNFIVCCIPLVAIEKSKKTSKPPTPHRKKLTRSDIQCLTKIKSK